MLWWKKFVAVRQDVTPFRFDEYDRTCGRMILSGALAQKDISNLDIIAQQYSMSEEDRKASHRQAITGLCQRIMADGYISIDEEANLEKTMHALGLTLQDLPSQVLLQMNQIKVIQGIRSGNLPTIPSAPLPLSPGEVVHYLTTACTMELKTVAQRTVGGSQGVSVRIAKGVTYRVGAYRGESVPIQQTLETSRGDLVLTSERIVYLGRPKAAFNAPWKKVVQVEMAPNGLHMWVSGRQTSVSLTLFSPHDVSVVEAVCMQYLR